MSFTDAEKVDIRRHCGYQAFGGVPTQAFAHRYFTHYGTLEYRMNNLAAAEETVARDYLSKLNTLEGDEYGVRANLDTEAAAVWKRNAREHAERQALYRSFQRKLLTFFGVPGGPGVLSGNTLSLVV